MQKDIMAGGGNPVAELEGAEVTISNLPKEVLDLILERLPTQDVARTSALSKSWRYKWTDHPKLVMDKQFFDELMERKSYFKLNMLGNLVHKILLQHFGPLLKFVINIALIDPQDVDIWLLFLSKKGIRELTIDALFYDDMYIHDPYEVASHIFSCHELTFLSMFNCIFKVPSKFEGFSKLIKLILDSTVLGPCLLVTPLLVHLELRLCLQILHFNVVAPILEVLYLEGNDCLELKNYMICHNLTNVNIRNYFRHQQGVEKNINMMKVLDSWPRLSELSVDGLLLKNLCADTAPEKLSITLNHLRCFTLRNADFDLDQIALVLCLLGSSPILHKFKILDCSFPSDNVKIFNYLEDPNCMNRNMEQLSIVQLSNFKGSRAEMQFVKILLSRSPSLERMFVQENSELDLNQRLRNTKDLLRFPRASTKAEVVFDY